MCNKFKKIIAAAVPRYQKKIILEIVENVLGANKRVSECTARQYDAVSVIYDDICDKIKELGI